MDRFRVVGPNRLEGRIRAAGAKNAALPSLAATLLTDAPVLLRGIPGVADIRTMRRLLAHDGVASAEEDGALRLVPEAGAAADEAPYELVKTMRASVLVLGPLLARRGRARVSLPGGCAIGVRPIDQHLAGLEALGAKVELDRGYVEARAGRLTAARFRFALPTVTGTENVMMAATLARGTTVLENCAREPEIEDLGRLLNAMGAVIEGAGAERITITGVDRLGGADHAILPDRIEGGTYLIAAALTGGDVTVDNLVAADLAPLLERLAETGAEVDSGPGWIRVRRDGELLPRDVVTAPHPGFPTDLQAQYMALMTQARGHAAICETVFENRFQHVPELARMGAAIGVEGNLARVSGPTPLSGAKVMATDLRASACLVLAGLAARGETWIDRIYHLDRGYEAMERKLQSLGARVERISGS
ncbi:MAG TPA: UDP-N-acetylglucosamine 1-carboxyvinyltransferase [Thermoanaerobaculia bacterium]|nr:UDP-N-acetylglucosamine 1-carboxyvinyltransferase [Thermoanaerobaculia bacterium]